jgi:hypothetical protein
MWPIASLFEQILVVLKVSLVLHLWPTLTASIVFDELLEYLL